MSIGAAHGTGVQRKPTRPAHAASSGGLGNTQVIRPETTEGAQAPVTLGDGSASAERCRLAWGLRALQRPRVGLCRTVRTASTVQLLARHTLGAERGRLILRGVATCGSVHSCPMCAAPILTERAAELTAALDSAGRENTCLVTLTLRHHAGIPLRVLRVLLARAYSELWAGNGGELLREECGLVGHVRAAEQTWGENGWHPHLHALLFFRRGWGNRWDNPEESAEQLIAARWARVVRQIFERLWTLAQKGVTFGGLADDVQIDDDGTTVEVLRRRIASQLGAYYSKEDCAGRCQEFLRGLRAIGGVAQVLPDDEHGVKLELCSTRASACYLAKMGVELSGIAGKVAATGHYTHWQIGDAAARGESWAMGLWREHTESMRGARQLTWSRGIRDLLGLEKERPDSVVAAEQESLTDLERGGYDVPLKEVEADAWDAMVSERTSSGGQARQLALASLYDSFRLGRDLPGRSLHGPPLPVGGVDVSAVWWERLQRDGHFRSSGAATYRRLSDTADKRAESRNRPYLSAAERELELEEVGHHLACDLGLTG